MPTPWWSRSDRRSSSGSASPTPSGQSQSLPGMLTELADSWTAAGISGTARTLLADAGYFSEVNVDAAAAAGIDPLLATGRLRRGEKPPPVPRGRIPAGLTPKQRMSRKLHTKKGKRDYARRKAIVEPVFGQIKVAQGAHQLRLRGKVKAEIEWPSHLACHNFRKTRQIRMDHHPDGHQLRAPGPPGSHTRRQAKGVHPQRPRVAPRPRRHTAPGLCPIPYGLGRHRTPQLPRQSLQTQGPRPRAPPDRRPRS